MYEELQEQIKREKDTLNGILGKVAGNKKKVDNKLGLAKEDNGEKRDKFNSLYNDMKKLRKKYNDKADIINDLIHVGVVLVYIAIIALILVYSMMLQKSLMFKIILAGIGTVCIDKLKDFVFDVIATFIEKRYEEKFKNSEEYKKLELQLKEAEKNWSKASRKVEKQKKILMWFSNVEKDLISRRDAKNSFLRYLERQSIPKVTTVHKSRGRSFKKVNKIVNEVTES